MDRVGISRRKWKKKTIHISTFISISLLTLFLSGFFISYHRSPRSVRFPSGNSLTPRPPLCTSHNSGEKFLWYAPHSGFSNQLSEFKNAILIASILNRTMIVPPALDHHAVALGSCPKFRVLHPSKLRIAVWDNVMELIRSGRYVSMDDIVDLSGLPSSSSIRTIDFRHFISSFCGVSPNFTCIRDSNFPRNVLKRLRQCGSMLSGLDGNIDNCLYALSEDCRTVVWTYAREGEDGALDSFQPDEQLKKKKKVFYVRTRRDVYKALGPASEAEPATVLAFGSLFTAPYKGSELYIDIHQAPNDPRVQHLIKRIKFLPFSPEIMGAGREFASKRIKAPFFCAQLRLLDGQFKNHWSATFSEVREKLEALKKNVSLPIHVFVMTDLPEGNWTGNYLGDLSSGGYFKLHVLSETDELVIRTAKKLMTTGHRNRLELVSMNTGGGSKPQKKCLNPELPDALLYIEKAVCSCASLGFSGTAGSTIADSIELMRSFGACSDQGHA